MKTKVDAQCTRSIMHCPERLNFEHNQPKCRQMRRYIKCNHFTGICKNSQKTFMPSAQIAEFRTPLMIEDAGTFARTQTSNKTTTQEH